ncbi:MAG: hypothetical protein J07HX64_00992 [halophilic archaeon J07HX64]|nr:MAG: hypothetical protein J07HX64_00992 [halophilic archaeon J07HX64]
MRRCSPSAGSVSGSSSECRFGPDTVSCLTPYRPPGPTGHKILYCFVRTQVISEQTEQEHVDPPEEAFAALGDETRLRILLELARVANERGVGAGLGFSELRQRVGVEDSGRFNYHLDKLSEGFITKRDGQYIPLGPTMEVASAIHVGTYSSDTGDHSTESDWNCPECGDRLLLRYTGEILFLRCERDDGYLLAYGIPSGAFEGRSLDELAAVTYLRMMSEINIARQGICPQCWGHTRVSYPVEPEAPPQLHAVGDAVQTRPVCDRCWLRYNVPPRAVVTSTPSVQSLLRRHGLDPVRAPITGRARDTTLHWEVSVDREDPVNATVRFELGTDTAAFDIDEDARILDRRYSGQA